MNRARALVVAGAIVVLLVSVGVVRALTRDDKKPFVFPRCTLPARAIKPPRPYPREFPLPKGTVFSTLGRYPGQIVLGGRAPLGFVATIRFLVREVPRKGFRLGRGESEPGFEAESDFDGHGVVGHFKVRILPRCRGAVLFVLAVARQGAVPTTPVPVAKGRLPTCAGAGPGRSSGLPKSFPLPAHTVIRSTTTRTIGGRTVKFVSAVAPGTVNSAARFILRKFRSGGYRLVKADAEATEADGAFVGSSVSGRIRFHTLFACPGVLTIDIATTSR